MSDDKDKSNVNLGLLEEDDEFEEFPGEDLNTVDDVKEEELNVWEDNWDDDNAEDDFNIQLKAHLETQERNPSPNSKYTIPM